MQTKWNFLKKDSRWLSVVNQVVQHSLCGVGSSGRPELPTPQRERWTTWLTRLNNPCWALTREKRHSNDGHFLVFTLKPLTGIEQLECDDAAHPFLRDPCVFRRRGDLNFKGMGERCSLHFSKK